MRTISIFGLGYVGTVSAACLAKSGLRVVGVDVNQLKVDIINEGRSPIIEAGIGELVQGAVAAGALRATTDPVEAVGQSEISLVCVGTPSNANGSLDLRYVERAVASIGEALAATEGRHVVVIRSTMLPGSTEETIIPALERASGRTVGTDLAVAYNPEFLREGSSVRDFRDPPYTIVAATDEQAAAQVAALYRGVSAPTHVVGFRVAEMLKYANNAFHALKVVFANEIGVLCKRQGIDGHELMALFCEDHRLNISSAYLKPGFAFGGSCLPKDLRALLHRSHALDLDPPLLGAILPSNRRHLDLAYEMIAETGCRRVGVLGFSFKAGTDDLRESPLVDLIERLIGRGYHVSVYDENVSLSNLHGANREYIEREIPHIASLMADSIEDVMERSEVIVIGNADPGFAEALRSLDRGQKVIDLVGVGASSSDAPGRYQGISW
jgi:GDP-mannose 6-dehydrogenase